VTKSTCKVENTCIAMVMAAQTACVLDGCCHNALMLAWMPVQAERKHRSHVRGLARVCHALGLRQDRLHNVRKHKLAALAKSEPRVRPAPHSCAKSKPPRTSTCQTVHSRRLAGQSSSDPLCNSQIL
jgi:hypothetical protein